MKTFTLQMLLYEAPDAEIKEFFFKKNVYVSF